MASIASSTSRAANGLVPESSSNALIADGAGALMVDGGALGNASLVGSLLSGLLPGAAGGRSKAASSTTGAADQSHARASAPAAADLPMHRIHLLSHHRAVENSCQL